MAVLLCVREIGLDTAGERGGCKTALLGPGLGLAPEPLVKTADEMPTYFARIACRRARLSANVSSIGFGSLSMTNSSSGSFSDGLGGLGCSGSFRRGGGLLGLIDSLVDVEGLGDGRLLATGEILI